MKEIVSYTNREIAEKFAIKGSNISYYTNKGIVEPSVHPGKGKGSNRLYSREDVVKLLLIKELGGHGFSLDQTKKVLRDISAGKQKILLDPAKSRDRIVILGIYDQATDNIQARIVAMPYPGKEPDQSDDLSELEIDLLSHSSALVINITPILQKVDVESNIPLRKTLKQNIGPQRVMQKKEPLSAII